MKLKDLCQYTLRQSINDTNDYPEPFVSAQEILDSTKSNGGK